MGRYFVEKNDRIERIDTYLVRVTTASGKVFERLEPRRLFPFSIPDKYVTLMNEDEKEEALIRDLSVLDEESRTAIEGCFADFYMIPEIIEFLHIEDKNGLFKMLVKTDHGNIEFQIRNRHSDIKQFDDILWIRDSNDNRYRTDITKLDDKSLKKILCYI